MIERLRSRVHIEPESDQTEDADLPPTNLTSDVILDAISNRRRRHIIRVVADHGRAMRIGELSERVASIENGRPAIELNARDRKRVYVALYQVHLPKTLGRHGIVEYNEDRGYIIPTPETWAVLARLDAATEGAEPPVDEPECRLCESHAEEPVIGGRDGVDAPEFVVCKSCIGGVIEPPQGGDA